jgi:hypothetical protein
LAKCCGIYLKLSTQKYGLSENVLKALKSIFLKHLNVMKVGSIFLFLNQAKKYLSIKSKVFYGTFVVNLRF